MSVLIKIKMPNTCKECIIGNPKNKTCYILGLPKRNLEIREDCPLIEVPTPHGNLIDMDNLLDRIKNPHADARLAEEITNWIMMSQTIVPTESEV